MKDLKLYFSAGVLLLIIYLIAQYNRPAPVDWRETFSRADKIPFGTYILFNRLNDVFPDASVTALRKAPYLVFTEDSIRSGCYLIIANKAKIDEYDFREMKKYMQRGNDIFLATYYPGKFISDSLKININTEYYSGSEAKTSLHFVNPSLNPEKKYQFKKGISDQYFSGFDTSKAVVLGMNSRGHANFIRYPYGHGNLYMIASPYFFTNYNLLQPEGTGYAAKVFILPQTRAGSDLG